MFHAPNGEIYSNLNGGIRMNIYGPICISYMIAVQLIDLSPLNSKRVPLQNCLCNLNLRTQTQINELMLNCLYLHTEYELL